MNDEFLEKLKVKPEIQSRNYELKGIYFPERKLLAAKEKKEREDAWNN